MSKHIKVIKCPHCGSTKVRETRPDYYQCEACSTEFFLDSDDININHRYIAPENNLLNGLNAKHLAIIGAILGFMIIPFVISTCFSFLSSDDPITFNSTANNEPKIEESFSFKKLVPFVTKDGRAVVAVFGVYSRGDYAKKITENQIRIYDLKKDEPIKTTQLPIEKLKEVEGRTFDDGSVNIILNNSTWYTIDKSTLDLKEMTNYKNVPELESGFANIKFLSNGDSDGFKIMTNTAKERFYLPIINKVYTQRELFEACEKPLPNPVVKTDFDFSRTTTDYPEQEIQLIKYSHYTQVGYPKSDSWSFGWCRDFGRKWGIFVGNEGSVKAFISTFDKERARLIKYENFTPDATYFSASVLWSNDSHVFIRFKSTASEDAEYVYQLLDATTAKPLWSVKEPENYHFYSLQGNVVHSPQGFIICGYNKVWLLGLNGKTVAIREF